MKSVIKTSIQSGILLVSLLLSVNLKAQTDTLATTVVNKSISVKNTNNEVKVHSAHKATLYSAVLPGLGQAYNKKYWKIPLVYAGIGGVIYGLSFNNKYYNIYKNAYRDFIIRDPANISYMDERITKNLPYTQLQLETSQANWYQLALRTKRTRYKRNRDLSIIGLAGIYVLNMIDASVDAHFFNFDISDDLTLNVVPEINANQNHQFHDKPTLGLKVNLKF